MKIGIVGGTGNISTSIVALLLQQGHEVVCFNRGERGKVPAGVREIHGDRANAADYEAAMQREKFDAAIDMICFNAAEAASSVRAFRGVRHFIQCSTVCTYGVQYDQFPTPEDHPLRPISDYGRNKVAADDVFLAAYQKEKFPVTIIKPSTTYGPQIGMLRQIAWDFGWIDRVRKGKPILICDGGRATHQFLHIDDAAQGFAGVLAHPHCIGKIYNLVRRECITWADYHALAMRVLGREVELVNCPMERLMKLEDGRFDICKSIFAYPTHYSPEQLIRDVPEFQPRVSLEQGMRAVIAEMDREKKIPNSDLETWEDELCRDRKQQ
jgi:nucleoside-diphosphate-sugar epimerase